MEEYDIYVSNVPGMYSYPYIAQITGEDEKYIFKRKFLRYAKVTPSWNDGKWYTINLPANGVYEECIKRKDKKTDELVGRERIWFLYFDGEYMDISKEEVLEAVRDPKAVINRYWGEC